MIETFNQIICFFILMVIYSCGAYTPVSTPPVVVEKAGDLQIYGGLNLSGNHYLTMDVDFAVSYGLTDNIYISNFDYLGTDKMYFEFLAGYKFKINTNSDIDLSAGYAWKDIKLSRYRVDGYWNYYPFPIIGKEVFSGNLSIFKNRIFLIQEQMRVYCR